MGKVKSWMKDKVLNSKPLQDMEITDHNNFVYQIMEEDGIDEETARCLCMGLTNPIDYRYTLGYKMSSQLWQYAMFHQKSKKKRMNARLNFRDPLCPEEQILFDEEVGNLEDMWVAKGKEISDEIEKKKKES